jgi:hypothetical protein
MLVVLQEKRSDVDVLICKFTKKYVELPNLSELIDAYGKIVSYYHLPKDNHEPLKIVVKEDKPYAQIQFDQLHKRLEEVCRESWSELITLESDKID